MKKLPTVRLKGRMASPHPHVWKGRVEPERVPSRTQPGSVVRILDREGTPIGSGLFHPHVTIALRILSRDPDEAIDAAFFRRRIESARALRHDLLRLPEHTSAYRLIHAEADDLPGLIVDVLGDVVRVDVFAKGMSLLLDPIREALSELLPGKRVVVRGDRRAQEIEGFRVAARPDDPSETEVQEYGVRFKVDLREGHKTGFFCDQRDNRSFLAGLARGRRLLDVNTYTGGFALHAAVRGEAKEVTGVDLDEKAIAVARRNAKLNQVQSKVRFVQSDAFPYLRDLKTKDRRPDLLVLDPPKLAKDRKEKEKALRTYSDLNRLGMECLDEGGVLLTCSCSGVVSEEDFLDVLRNAAARSGRLVTILRVTGAADDHPVALHVPETRYLKAVFARVHAL